MPARCCKPILKGLRSLIFSFFLLCWGFGFPLQALERSEPQPLRHEKKLFQSPEGKIYLPQGLPLYLSLSTHPKGPGMELPNQESLDKKQSIPLLLDSVEGRHSLIHPEHYQKGKGFTQQKKANLFYLHLDATPPRSEVSASKGNKVRLKNRMVYGNPVSLSLMGKEVSKVRSGVAGVYVSAETKRYQLYTSPFYYESEGDYEFYYYGVDQVGNVEKPKHFRFSLDFTPPTSQLTVLGPKQEDTFSRRTKIKLQASDAVAGVAQIHYRLQGPTKQKGIYRKQPLSFAKLKNGPYQLSYWALDRVGNREPTQEFSFYLDRLGPQVQVSAEGPSWRYKNKLFLNPQSRLLLTGVDQRSGVERIMYRLGRHFVPYQGPLTLPQQRRSQIAYYALDQVGNRSSLKKLTLVRDDSIPYTSHVLYGPIHREGLKIYGSRKTTIKLEGEDSGSGIASIFYQVDEGAEEKFQRSFNLETEGEHVIRYRAVDRVDNAEATKRLRLTIDNQPPEIAYQFGSPQVSSELDKPVYPLNTLLFVVAVDHAAGLNQLRYRINNQAPHPFSEPLRFRRRGSYQVTLAAEDRVGNIKMVQFKFLIR